MSLRWPAYSAVSLAHSEGCTAGSRWLSGFGDHHAPAPILPCARNFWAQRQVPAGSWLHVPQVSLPICHSVPVKDKEPPHPVWTDPPPTPPDLLLLPLPSSAVLHQPATLSPADPGEVSRGGNLPRQGVTTPLGRCPPPNSRPAPQHTHITLQKSWHQPSHREHHHQAPPTTRPSRPKGGAKAP